MVSQLKYFDEMVMFFANPSLITQVAQRLGDRSRQSLRLISPKTSMGIASAMEDASMAIIDATSSPQWAINTLDLAIGTLGQNKTVVYTEHYNEELEVFVRSRGAMFLSGPVNPDEWDAVIDSLQKSETEKSSVGVSR